MQQPVEWLATTEMKQAPFVVPFKNLFPMKEQITSLLLLFNCNSYLVDVTRRLFIINGGRRLHLEEWKKAANVKVLYARRNQKTISTDGQDISHEVSFLLGLQGVIDGEEKQLMIHISPDGSAWCWRNRR